ncbi:MAG: GNAT family N-acetyltransferase [Caldilineaceae bacterium]
MRAWSALARSSVTGMAHRSWRRWVVDETKRGQGIGRALVRALVAHHFAQHPAEVLYLFCLSTLEHYYQPFGFQRAVRQELPWPLAVSASGRQWHWADCRHHRPRLSR